MSNHQKKKVIVFLGAPGCGKGTQARLLWSELNIPLIGMGDLIREEIGRKTTLGEKLEKFVNKGEMPSWHLVKKIFSSYLEKIQSSFVIFDGIPRNEEQMHDVDDILEKKNYYIVQAIFLNVPKEHLIKRMLQRFHCSCCGAPYSRIDKNADDSSFYCNFCKCSSYLTRRSDDEEAVIRKRIMIYEKNIKPLLNHYKKKNILTEIDGTLSKEKIKNLIISKIPKQNVTLLL